ncbi:PREDICTED: uncharacterized protein LOC109215856 [Nicotiana attenuata]|uniref:uncharacterized protein LOC109215856 n=1 Tax=Nicotiana attenuata TaxID=49451 RepID=UPI0009050977|nr:PREDICTED: uncharacterized protein LOC109215856 [Nicotiana attenuata]
MALVERFADFDDPMEKIKKIKQTGSVKEYQAVFERNLNRHELNIAVKLTNPTPLSRVYRTARMHEVYLAVTKQPTYTTSVSTKRYAAQSNNSKPLLPTPNSGSSNYTKGFTKRALSIDEMNEKREKGLCYFCNEKYVPGYRCNSSKQLYLLELEEIEERPYAGEGQELEIQEEEIDLLESSQGMEQMEISIHAQNGPLGYRTLKVTGYHAKKALSILIDTGSSHNFIDPEFVKHLGCTIQSTKPQLVAAANGNIMVDRVCTITWLLQGAEFSAEFLLLPLGSCGVVGAGNQVKVQEADKIVKHTGDLSQLCMIQLVPMGETEEQWHAIKAEEEPVVDNSLTQLLTEYSGLFEEPTGLPPSRGVFDHRIILDQGIIQPSCSSFASPVVLVGKKDGSWRLCVDYRDLNKHMVKNKFLIPIVEYLLDELGGSKVFSIDLWSGYHQLRMAKEDVPKTAFRTHSGHFEYLVMPFGLSNAPATFQGLMNSIFQKFLRKHVLVFFDDILIYSSTLEDYLTHLKSVFVDMSKHQLFAKKSKCFFGVQKIEYLGHFISAEGVSTDPQKIAVQNWPTPTTLKQLRGFLGLAGYYRRFIKGFGVICKPLTDLTKKDGFKWSTSADAAFAALKEALTQAPVLALPDATKTFIVETYASGHGIGVALMQEGHPIAFISKALSPKHAALSVYDRELLEMVHAVSKWSQYLLGQKFIIRTDQKALKYLME